MEKAIPRGLLFRLDGYMQGVHEEHLNFPNMFRNTSKTFRDFPEILQWRFKLLKVPENGFGHLGTLFPQGYNI